MSHVLTFRCPNCASVNGTLRFMMESWEMIGCCQCNAEMLWPIPSESELAEYYAQDTSYDSRSKIEAQRYLQDPSGWRNHAINFAAERAESGMLPGACYLDVGCSYGFQVIELAKLGFDAWGQEYSSDAVSFMNSNGGNGYCGSIFDESFPLSQVDYCYSSNAFEHMSNPYQVIKKIHQLLRPNGVLEIQLPHWGSLVAGIPGRRWKWLVPRDHIHYFRAATLPGILEGIGFSIENISTTADAEEIIEVFDAFGIPAEQRSAESMAAVSAILKNGKLGHQLKIVARVKV